MVVSPCCIEVISNNSNQSISSCNQMAKVKSEDEIGKKMDRCAADVLLKVGGGLAVGVIFSVVLLKRRTWPVWLGTGVGLGMGYANCQHDFREPYVIRGKKVNSLEISKDKLKPSEYYVIAEKPKESAANAK